MRRRWSDRSSRRVRTLVTQLARSRLIRESGRMRADIHDGPEQTLQSEAGYTNARPHQPGRRNLLHRTAGPYSRVNNGPDGSVTSLLVYPEQRTRRDRLGWSVQCRFCCRSRLLPMDGRPFRYERPALIRWRCRPLRNPNATRCTELEQVAAERRAMQVAVGSGRWPPERTHPGRLGDHAVEVDRASGCASSVRTASRSSCAHVATAQSPQCQRTIAQRLGHAHGCRAGSCAVVPLGSTAV